MSICCLFCGTKKCWFYFNKLNNLIQATTEKTGKKKFGGIKRSRAVNSCSKFLHVQVKNSVKS